MATSGATKSHFKFVHIPADPSDSMEDIQLSIPEGREVEVLLEHCKEHFRSKGGQKTEAQIKAQKEALMKQLGPAAANIDEKVLAAATEMQMVETINLLSGTPRNNHVSVNLYTDDEAQAKALPPNPRASQIAQCCGKMVEVRGDAFLAKVIDTEDKFERLDMSLAEVSSSADWVRQAAADASRRAQEGDRAAEFMTRVRGMQGGQQAPSSSSRPAAQVQELTPAEAAKESGNAAFKKGNWEEAIEHYSAALNLDPKLLAARNNRAMALLKLGRHAEVVEDCGAVLAQEGGNVKALLRRSAAYEALGKLPEAEADLQAVLAKEGSNKEAAAALARLQAGKQ